MYTFARFGAISSPKCCACAMSVFKMEEIIAIGKTWHKACFKCGGVKNLSCPEFGCGRGITLNTFQEYQREPMCK